ERLFVSLGRLGLRTDGLGRPLRTLGIDVAGLDDIQVEFTHLPLESEQMSASHRAKPDHGEIDPVVGAPHAGVSSRPESGNTYCSRGSVQEITPRYIGKRAHRAPPLRPGNSKQVGFGKCWSS